MPSQPTNLTNPTTAMRVKGRGAAAAATGSSIARSFPASVDRPKYRLRLRVLTGIVPQQVEVLCAVFGKKHVSTETQVTVCTESTDDSQSIARQFSSIVIGAAQSVTWQMELLTAQVSFIKGQMSLQSRLILRGSPNYGDPLFAFYCKAHWISTDMGAGIKILQFVRCLDPMQKA